MNDWMPSKSGIRICACACMMLMLCGLVYSHGHGKPLSHSETGYGPGTEREEGSSEATGQIAAWLFGIANFPVVVSVLLKACRKVAPQNLSLRKKAEQLNRQQKRYLMKLHYWLNPVAAAAAIFHFLITDCKSTVIPELGLGIMLLVFILGLMMTFKLSPVFMRKTVARFHMSPITLAVVLSIIMIGHSMID